MKACTNVSEGVFTVFTNEWASRVHVSLDKGRLASMITVAVVCCDCIIEWERLSTSKIELFYCPPIKFQVSLDVIRKR